MARLALITLLLVGTLQAQTASGKGVVTLKPPPNCSTDPGFIRPCDNSDKALELTDQLMQLVRNQQETIKTLIENERIINRALLELDQRIRILEQQKESK